MNCSSLKKQICERCTGWKSFENWVENEVEHVELCTGCSLENMIKTSLRRLRTKTKSPSVEEISQVIPDVVFNNESCDKNELRTEQTSGRRAESAPDFSPAVRTRPALDLTGVF